MQASSKQNGITNLLPPHPNGQSTVLSASFEKLNFLGQHHSNNAAILKAATSNTNHMLVNASGAPSSLSQSSHSQGNTLRSQQQVLRQQHPQTTMQSYLHGATQTSASGKGPGAPLPNTSGLKVKRSGIKTVSSKTFMTPQRMKKGKEATVAQGHQQRVVAHYQNRPDNTSESILNIHKTANSSNNSKGKQANKAQQFLRNSFMIKQQHTVGGQP